MILALYLTNTCDKKQLIRAIMQENLLADHIDLTGLHGLLHSTITIDKLIDDEYRHDRFPIQTEDNDSLESMSSGQQKKALLNYLIEQKPDYLVLDDVYSNVDKATQVAIRERLTNLSVDSRLIQIVFRKADILPATQIVLSMDGENSIIKTERYSDFMQHTASASQYEHRFRLPEGYTGSHCEADPLIELRNVSVHYLDKPVLDRVNWNIRKGEFWQLVGPNGAGKSTLITLITGDNPRGYGQDMMLFGMKKGSGETIWDIRKQIGYYTPNMTTRFTRNDSVLNMIISGFNDSIGLYAEPTDYQIYMAEQWLTMLGNSFRNKSFQDLSIGQQRMVMVARAMVKHPPLLILDEPTIELDEENSRLFIDMVNAIAAEKQVAIIYISHRDEEDLKPSHVFELVASEKGYTGVVRG
ncbi:ATP-binding cassette domain-containing protein [Parabacteroides sp. FAFU027]|uniref:ATP-binding cassette domain-containing protein n=1 Tax=Parabacteroides sp. FAFU027 TaxID=2922715 RepID=UPI001FAF851F|nr:ATP-binding cassette domain-containing protein [Parabacteroides sp. FAFU027]